MRVSLVAEHLKQYAPIFERRVAGGMDIDVVLGSAKMDVPAAYVAQAEDDAGNLLSQTSYLQEVNDSIDVVVVLPVRDEQGVLVSDLLHDVRRQLLVALAGWEPDEGYEGLVYEGGSLVRIDRARCSYRFSFSAEFTVGRAGLGGEQPELPETWLEYQLDGLPALEGVNLRIDAIDPMADPNLKKPGPDGRIEHDARLELPNGEN